VLLVGTKVAVEGGGGTRGGALGRGGQPAIAQQLPAIRPSAPPGGTTASAGQTVLVSQNATCPKMTHVPLWDTM
jgi:hypothetical protein